MPWAFWWAYTCGGGGGGGAYIRGGGGLIYGQDFGLAILTIYTGGLIYGWAYIRNGESVCKLVGLNMGGLIFGGDYIRRFTVYNRVGYIYTIF